MSKTRRWATAHSRSFATVRGSADEIGLGYLTLDRVAGTLRVARANVLRFLPPSPGADSLAPFIYSTNRSIGLHPRDTHLLIDIVKQFTAAGNTVVVVEHDEEMMARRPAH